MSIVEIVSHRKLDSKIANVAAIALMLTVDSEIRILMAERVSVEGTKFIWTMPGGKKKKSESIRQCGVRELYEETELKVKTSDLNLVGDPIVISPSVIIQYLFCHLDTSAPWQYIRNTEPDKMGPWSWITMNDFSALSHLGVYPDLDVSGHKRKIVKMTKKRGSLIDDYARDNSWLGWLHEKDLRRMYGVKNLGQ